MTLRSCYGVVVIRESETASEQATATFKAAWAEYVRLGDLADAAFDRWFKKARNGEPTNAAAATRLANLTSYASADMQSAATKLYLMDIDPQTIEPEYQP